MQQTNYRPARNYIQINNYQILTHTKTLKTKTTYILRQIGIKLRIPCNINH